MGEEIKNRLKELLMGDPTAKTNAGRTGYLKMNGLSVEQFARKSGVTRTSIYFYMNDRSRPTLDTLVRMSEAMQIPLSELKQHCPTRNPGRQPSD